MDRWHVGGSGWHRRHCPLVNGGVTVTAGIDMDMLVVVACVDQSLPLASIS